MAPTEPETRRIVLLGKTGSGKSSLANTLFGEEEVFKVDDSANSGTKLCESKVKNINGRNIQLIDTPGLFDTDPRSTELNPEILKCIITSTPGPHAFLIVLKVEKYTMLEIAVVALMLKYFSKEALKYTTVVFTRGDDLQKGKRIEDWVNENEALSDLVQKCGGRCHVFDNKYWNNSQDQYRNNQYQVQELLKTIDQTVRENGGGYYTNEMLQRIQVDKQDMAEQIKKSSPGNISDNDIDKKANEGTFSKIMSLMGSVKTGILIGAFLGGLGIGGLACYCGASTLAIIGAGVLGAVAGGAAGGAVEWAVKASKRSPPEPPQDAISFSKDIEDLFLQLQKISKGVIAMTGVVSKSKSD